MDDKEQGVKAGDVVIMPRGVAIQYMQSARLNL